MPMDGTYNDEPLESRFAMLLDLLMEVKAQAEGNEYLLFGASAAA